MCQIISNFARTLKRSIYQSAETVVQIMSRYPTPTQVNIRKLLTVFLLFTKANLKKTLLSSQVPAKAIKSWCYFCAQRAHSTGRRTQLEV